MPNDQLKSAKQVRTIAIASGKGGVGKTNITASLAIAMRKQGKNVLIIDGDLGLSNIDILLDLRKNREKPEYTIKHLLDGALPLKDILKTGPHGIKILPAGGGLQELTQLDEFQRLNLIEAFDAYDDDVDVLLIDTAAGIAENVTFFCAAAQDIVVVTSPEPTAWVDAYRLIKVLNTEYQESRFHILINSVKDEKEALSIYHNLTSVADKYLSVSLDYLGYLPYDDDVKQAVRAQKAFIDLFPKKFISTCIADVARSLLEREVRIKGSLQFFIGNLLEAQSASTDT